MRNKKGKGGREGGEDEGVRGGSGGWLEEK